MFVIAFWHLVIWLSSYAIIESKLHIIFSTECSSYHDWQSILLLHSARVVKQSGTITRIASGCTSKKQEQLQEQYSKIFPTQKIVFTPDFSKDETSNKSFVYYNKPRGVKYWIRHAKPQDGEIIALIDPDFIFLRPLSVLVHSLPEILFDKSNINKTEIFLQISKGHPVGQRYLLDSSWTTNELLSKRFVCHNGSNCLTTTRTDATKHFSVGPPYLLEASDFKRLTKTWTIFMPRVYQKYKHILADMYAYALAAAHEQLPHLQLEHYMVSNIDAIGEGWKYIDELHLSTCDYPDQNGFHKGKLLPTFLHYCNSYDIGVWQLNKRRILSDILNCSHPIFKDPSFTIKKVMELVGVEPNTTDERIVTRGSFAICTFYRAANAALIYFKERTCVKKPNLSKSYYPPS